MGNPFALDPEALAAALHDMADFQRVAASLLDEIESTVRDVHITWDGEAAAAHAEAHRLWTHGAAQMQDALRSLHAAGGHAQGNYTQAMHDNQGMWT